MMNRKLVIIVVAAVLALGGFSVVALANSQTDYQITEEETAWPEDLYQPSAAALADLPNFVPVYMESLSQRCLVPEQIMVEEETSSQLRAAKKPKSLAKSMLGYGASGVKLLLELHNFQFKHEMADNLLAVQDTLDKMIIDINNAFQGLNAEQYKAEFEAKMNEISTDIANIESQYQQLCLVYGYDIAAQKAVDSQSWTPAFIEETFDDLMLQIKETNYDAVLTKFDNIFQGSANSTGMVPLYNSYLGLMYPFEHENYQHAKDLYQYLVTIELMATWLQVEYYHSISGPYNPNSAYAELAFNKVDEFAQRIDQLYQLCGLETMDRPEGIASTITFADGQSVDGYEVVLNSDKNTYFIPQNTIFDTYDIVDINKGAKTEQFTNFAQSADGSYEILASYEAASLLWSMANSEQNVVAWFAEHGLTDLDPQALSLVIFDDFDYDSKVQHGTTVHYVYAGCARLNNLSSDVGDSTVFDYSKEGRKDCVFFYQKVQ